MDIKIALVELATIISDNREETMKIIQDYILLRSSLSKRKEDNNLVNIFNSLDQRYSEVLEEINNEYSILCSIASYLAVYIGYSENTGEYLYNCAKEIHEIVDRRLIYEISLYDWYSEIVNSPVKTTKNYDFPKYEKQISRSDVVKVFLLQKI